MKAQRSLLRRITAVIFCAAILVALTVFVCLSLMIQMNVRHGIRNVRSGIQPISFASADYGNWTVFDKDLFLFCRKSGAIVPARESDTRHDFIGPLIGDFDVGTNRIFVLVDNRCPQARLEEISRGFAEACSNKVFAVGCLLGDEEALACVEWKGQLPTNGLHGVRLDCSIVDSLFYVSPFVCNPIIGWFGDMMGVKCEFQRPWYRESGNREEDGILDLYPGLATNVVAVRAGTKIDSSNPDAVYLDFSNYIDTICGKDPTSDYSYAKRDYALRCISSIRKLAKEDVSDLKRYLRAADRAMSEECVAKLKVGVVELLCNQDPQPEGIADMLLEMLADAEQPTEVLRICVERLGELIGELDDTALLKCFDGDSGRANAVAAAVKRIIDDKGTSCSTQAATLQSQCQ